ncbi:MULTISPECIES: diiron oxygenase [unclassified Aeromicrobium]|uniref:AurF N-oxygenase family protein n=1 Tax=unclassified Aeromicrobium TaxID=2633570 RepID=UPI00288B6AC0|nr:MULTISPECIES: diiron oxygenase [unclassified Aeromicrobium]
MTLMDEQDLDRTQDALSSLTRREYEATLTQLSQASVDRHFDAFVDVPWDHPDFAIDPTDAHWVLPEADPLGAHPWYKSLPVERQIEIGMWRYANIFKVGLQFENLLIRGIMQYVFSRPNGSAEFRYLTHEATEECHHTQMFQECINRIGADVPGMPRWMRAIHGIIPLMASRYPLGFFIAVLAGEEPIDHTQKKMLREGATIPPVMRRIMQIHVAEEARHISFAHAYVMRSGPNLGKVDRWVMSMLFPIIMRIAGDLILVPPKELRTEMGVPKKVVKELYWDAPESRVFLAELFSDVRMLAEESTLMTRSSRRMWRWLKIDGRPARYRSEPPARLADPASVDPVSVDTV